jgi:hypothetical protein
MNQNTGILRTLRNAVPKIEEESRAKLRRCEDGVGAVFMGVNQLDRKQEQASEPFSGQIRSTAFTARLRDVNVPKFVPTCGN